MDNIEKVVMKRYGILKSVSVFYDPNTSVSVSVYRIAEFGIGMKSVSVFLFLKNVQRKKIVFCKKNFNFFCPKKFAITRQGGLGEIFQDKIWLRAIQYYGMTLSCVQGFWNKT